jgi:hypothetical protein
VTLKVRSGGIVRSSHKLPTGARTGRKAGILLITLGIPQVGIPIVVWQSGLYLAIDEYSLTFVSGVVGIALGIGIYFDAQPPWRLVCLIGLAASIVFDVLFIVFDVLIALWTIKGLVGIALINLLMCSICFIGVLGTMRRRSKPFVAITDTRLGRD